MRHCVVWCRFSGIQDCEFLVLVLQSLANWALSVSRISGRIFSRGCSRLQILNAWPDLPITGETARNPHGAKFYLPLPVPHRLSSFVALLLEHHSPCRSCSLSALARRQEPSRLQNCARGFKYFAVWNSAMWETLPVLHGSSRVILIAETVDEMHVGKWILLLWKCDAFWPPHRT